MFYDFAKGWNSLYSSVINNRRGFTTPVHSATRQRISQDLRSSRWRALRQTTHRGDTNASGRARALNPLFIAAISLGKYSEARGHIDVACVHGGGALIITYHARKARYASYARGQKRPSHSVPPFHPSSLTSRTYNSHHIPALLYRRCLPRPCYQIFMRSHLCRDVRDALSFVHLVSRPKGSPGSSPVLFFSSFGQTRLGCAQVLG